mmetsp:Transcript_22544/g.21773  ORF Transcript_22544/g.21773 Transcript_22544/m.21773 type:complete len:297 (+) Transcript_22544:101-991(+)
MSSFGSMEDTKKLISVTLKDHTKNLAIWGGFLTSSLIVFLIFSSRDFSFLLTYASFMRCFGFGLLNVKMWSGKSGKGVSLKTIQLYAVTFSIRLLSILRHQGYLPFDKTGDWFYHLIEIVSLVSCCFAMYGMVGPLKSTYEEKYDKFGSLHIPNEFGALYCIVPCGLLALFFHPTLNREFFSDVCWTYSMYLEAVAMLPQIFMFQKQASDQGGIVEPLIGHTVFALGFSRIFELIFWLGSFRELSDHAGSRMPGYIVLLSQLGHLIIMGDFFYYYFNSLRKGLPLQLPLTTYSTDV